MIVSQSPVGGRGRCNAEEKLSRKQRNEELMLCGQKSCPQISTLVGTTPAGCAVLWVLLTPFLQIKPVIPTSSNSQGFEQCQATPRLSLPTQVFTLLFFTVCVARRTCCLAEGSRQYLPYQDNEKKALSLCFSHLRAQPHVVAPCFLCHVPPQCTFAGGHLIYPHANQLMAILSIWSAARSMTAATGWSNWPLRASARENPAGTHHAGLRRWIQAHRHI